MCCFQSCHVSPLPDNCVVISRLQQGEAAGLKPRREVDAGERRRESDTDAREGGHHREVKKRRNEARILDAKTSHFPAPRRPQANDEAGGFITPSSTTPTSRGIRIKVDFPVVVCRVVWFGGHGRGSQAPGARTNAGRSTFLRLRVPGGCRREKKKVLRFQSLFSPWNFRCSDRPPRPSPTFRSAPPHPLESPPPLQVCERLSGCGEQDEVAVLPLHRRLRGRCVVFFLGMKLLIVSVFSRPGDVFVW